MYTRDRALHTHTPNPKEDTAVAVCYYCYYCATCSVPLLLLQLLLPLLPLLCVRGGILAYFPSGSRAKEVAPRSLYSLLVLPFSFFLFFAPPFLPVSLLLADNGLLLLSDRSASMSGPGRLFSRRMFRSSVQLLLPTSRRQAALAVTDSRRFLAQAKRKQIA